jgi:hypothetical protein
VAIVEALFLSAAKLPELAEKLMIPMNINSSGGLHSQSRFFHHRFP